MRVSENELWLTAEKALRGYVNKVFPEFFRKEDVEDMVVLTAEKAWRMDDKYDPARGTYFNWVWVIARSVVLTRAVRLKKERERFCSLDSMQSVDADDLDPCCGYEQPADSGLLEEELEETFLGKLASERDKLILCWLTDGLDDGEIAGRLGISKQAAYTAIFRVRNRLRRAA